jgi:hypothetical protein
MALYDRIRIIDTGSQHWGRDAVSAQQSLDCVYAEMGANYAGYIVEDGCSLCHQYLLDKPTDTQLASLLVLATTRKVRLYREEPDRDSCRFSLDDLVQKIAATLTPMMMAEMDFPSATRATATQAWNSVQIMREMIKQLTA